MKGGKPKRESETEQDFDPTTAPLVSSILPGSKSIDCEPEHRQKAIYEAIEESRRKANSHG